mgnify:CR=1 FL=1
MVKPQTNIELHDLIIVFNDIIAKHIANINDKRHEIRKLRAEIETKYALVGDNNTDANAAAVIYKNELVKAEKRIKELEEQLKREIYFNKALKPDNDDPRDYPEEQYE